MVGSFIRFMGLKWPCIRPCYRSNPSGFLTETGENPATLTRNFIEYKMKVKLAIAFTILLAGCASQQSAFVNQKNRTAHTNKFANEVPILTIKGLTSFKTSYKDAHIHKAFAQSDSGTWAWEANRNSKEQAINDALALCQSSNKKYEEMYPCKVINVNDEWV